MGFTAYSGDCCTSCRYIAMLCYALIHIYSPSSNSRLLVSVMTRPCIHPPRYQILHLFASEAAVPDFVAAFSMDLAPFDGEIRSILIVLRPVRSRCQCDTAGTSHRHGAGEFPTAHTEGKQQHGRAEQDHEKDGHA